jgi:Xaa-Pro aminopeptidase
MNQKVAAPARDRTDIPPDEYRERVRRVADEIADRGLEAALVWSKCGGTVDRYADVLYLTNHYSQFPHVYDLPPNWAGRSQAAVLVTRDGETVLFSDMPDWRRDLVVADRVVVSVNLPESIGAVIEELGLTRARLGLVGADTMLLGTWRLLRSRLAGVEWIPVEDVLERMRAIKSPAELGVIRESVAIGDSIMTAMLEACVPGNTEADVAAAGYDVAIRSGAAPYDLPGASGPFSSSFSHGSLPSWSMRTLEEGDLWHSDMYGAFHGYYYDYTRSTVVGAEPTEDQLKVLEGSIGHSIGLAWEAPWMVPGNNAKLEPNMYLAVEAAVGLPGVGAAGFEEDLIITEDGVEILSTVTPRWWAKGV